MAGFEPVPTGRTEPFETSQYDVLPRERYDFVVRDYYSPIPDLSQLPEEIWTRRSALGGIELSAEASMAFVETELGSFIAELEFPLEHPGEAGIFFLNNTRFESVDAELLYGMVRALRPTRVVELGSGYSTLLINMAAQRNRDEGGVTEHVAFDPYPNEQLLGKSVSSPTKVESIPATEVPMDVFDALGDGDVLFVDTTHTVKLGSDVNFVLLEVLPRLQPGVVVHFHDIFLPWDYPRVWVEKMHYYWAEQYLLQAFLAFNHAFGVLVPAQALARGYSDRLGRVVPSFLRGASPASMWLRRSVAPGEDAHSALSLRIQGV